jgi:hypothetical protein
MRLTVLTLLAVLACAGAGSLPSWYKCTCPSAPAASGTPCVCPSTAAPGNLPTASVPQFVLFTVSCMIVRCWSYHATLCARVVLMEHHAAFCLHWA